MVNNKECTALCKIESSSFLKCNSNHNNPSQNDDIKIAGNKISKLGTVNYIQNLNEEQKKIIPFSLSINYESIENIINSINRYEFSIKGNLKNQINYDISEDTITKIEVMIEKNNNEVKKEVICLTNNINKLKGSNVYLSCEIEESISNDQNIIFKGFTPLQTLRASGSLQGYKANQHQTNFKGVFICLKIAKLLSLSGHPVQWNVLLICSAAFLLRSFAS